MVGVGGESIFGIRAWWNNRKLHDVQDAIETSRQTEAARGAELLKLDIANANERAAALEIEALNLRRQLSWQGPRGTLLVAENKRKLVDALKRFSGQKIDVRHSASTIMVNGSVVMSTPIGDDSLGLANAMLGVLKEAGWAVPPTSLISGFQGSGVDVEVLHNSSHETQVAAAALVGALRQVPIGANGPVSVTEDHAKRVGTEVISPAFDENTIILLVLTHP